MAQADSVRSSSRQLITGESANQSTSLRAIKLPAVRVQPVDRRYLIRGSDAPVITDTEEAHVLCLWRVHIDLEDVSNYRWYAANTGQEPLGSNIGALPFETAGFLLGWLLRNILILLRFRSRNKRLRFRPFDGASSNRLVPSKPQGRLR
jgi:hypothetical protein